MARLRPFGVGAADAVQQIKDGVLATGRVTGRRIDPHPPACSERLGIVLDGSQFAVRNIVALLVEAGRWIGEGGFIVRAQLDRSAESPSASASAGTVSYTHLRAHETRHDLVCRLLLEKK